MRVLFVTPFYEPAWTYGGIVRASRDWAYALVHAGVEVSVYTTTANGNCELEIPIKIPLDRNGVKVTYFPRLSWSGNRFLSLPLFQACLHNIGKFDIVHSIGLWTFPSFISSWIASAKNIPFIVSLHGMLMPWALQHNQLIKKIFFSFFERPRLTRSESVICCTKMEKDKFIEGKLDLPVCVIPNIVHFRNLAVDPHNFRRQFNLSDAFIILFAGRIVKNKGLHLTLEAFARIAKLYKDAHLVIVGPVEDSSIALIKQNIQDLGIRNRISLTGLLTGNDYWDALSSADLFVLNSYSENFGLSPAEALAHGIPVVVSDQVGIAEYVTNYQSGWVVPLNIDAITDAFNAALSERKILPEMGKNGIRLVQENFSTSTVGQKFIKLLVDVLAQRKKLSA